MKIIQKIEAVKNLLVQLSSKEELYQKIMELGKELEPFKTEWKKEENRVVGCQSTLYLHSEYEEGMVYFYASTDALITAGLAALLINVYSGEAPESVLMASPAFIEEIGLPSALTPGRANGLASLYIKMKREALKYLLPR